VRPRADRAGVRRVLRLWPIVVACALALPGAAWASGGTDHGERVVDGRLVKVPVDEQGVTDGAHGAAPAASAVSPVQRTAAGPRPLAVVQILMPGTTATPYTDGQLRALFATASDWLAETTDGAVSLSGAAGPEVDIAGTVTASGSTGCGSPGDRWRTWASEAVDALAGQGVDLSPYLAAGHVAYVLRGTNDCGWSGLAWLPGREIWLNNSLSATVTVHELGHNLRLDHAASMRCTSGGVGVLLSSSCTTSEYGDPFDPMGNGARHFSAAHKLEGGWLPGDRVRTVSANGTFALGAASDALAPTRMLRIPRGSGQPALTVELRRPFGSFDAFGAGDAAVNGVLLRLRNESAIDLTKLLDARPSTATFNDASLPVGQTVTDDVGHVSVTLNALAGGTATVSVDLRGTGPDVTAPAAPVVTATATADGRIALSWPPAADDVATTSYTVRRDGADAAQMTAPGWTDEGVPAGVSRSYVVVARDAAGNATASAPVAATVPAAPPEPPPTTTTTTPPPPPTTAPPATTTTTAPPPAPPAPPVLDLPGLVDTASGLLAPVVDALRPPAATRAPGRPASSSQRTTTRRRTVRRCRTVRTATGRKVRRCKRVTVRVRVRRAG
jgi:hypothetical protein